ncbi:MAG: valine--tRNA ligase [Paracoccaceae bacterium]
MSIPNKFNPKQAEKKINDLWEDTGAFRSGKDSNKGKPPFSIMIPPPNVTGSLHIGHAFNNTIQDILVRFHRMNGYDVLWQPGQDHAGIATQMVVERELEKNNKSRQVMGRERFLEEVWSWKEKSGNTIIDQLKRLGASCDWSRNRFTMDPDFHKAVVKVFVDFYNRGLIYKGKKLVNWDPKFQSAISDLEVEQIEVQGKIWELKYFLEQGTFNFGVEVDENGEVVKQEHVDHVVIATTRPETLLGDTAVIVNPSDKRYRDLIGKSVILPLVGRKIPVIADDYADPSKGTGAVKITPAHDFNDWEVGVRHNLRVINIFDTSANIKVTDNADFLDGINPSADIFQLNGLERFEARKRILEKLSKEGFLAAEKEDVHFVPHGDRSKVVVEPYLTTQWFVDSKKIVQEAIDVVRNNEIEIIPERDKKVYFNWLENIEPWCISRQLWWGHQIPVWYDNEGNEYCTETFEEAKKLAGHSDIYQDSDVLDTWFSSGIWPIGTLGWPEKSHFMERYYPTSVLVTGFDIIFFWVARMIMMQLATVKEVPFKKVYVHALVRDENGKKMSKSLGNVLDPLDLIDKYGADPLRFTLTAMAVTGRDLKLSESRIEGYRNFMTKIWNAAKYLEMNDCHFDSEFDVSAVISAPNKWIIGKTLGTLESINQSYSKFRFNDTANNLYTHTWGVFCDWYIEFSKSLLKDENKKTVLETRKTLAWAFEVCLKMLHPIMPFVTEELWGHFRKGEGLLANSNWPKVNKISIDEDQIKNIENVISFIEDIRSTKSDFNLVSGEKTELYVVDLQKKQFAYIEENEKIICRLARLLEIKQVHTKPKNVIAIRGGKVGAFVAVQSSFNLELEKDKISSALKKLEIETVKLSEKLNNKNFRNKAPEKIIEKFEADHEDLMTQLNKQRALLESLEKIDN